MKKYYSVLLTFSFQLAIFNAFGQDWMPFQPNVRYTYKYAEAGKTMQASNKSSALVTSSRGKWISFQHTFPVGTYQPYVRYSWIEFDSSQCPLNSNGQHPSPLSIALPSSLWGSEAGITNEGWAKIYFSTYSKPIDSVQFNIHAALNQDFVYKPSTGATARITEKAWINLVTQVSDSALKFMTSDNQIFWLSKTRGFFMLPTLAETNAQWTSTILQLVTTQGLPGLNQYKKKVKDLFGWQMGDTLGYHYLRYGGSFGMIHLENQYWIRYAVLQRQELNNGDSVRFMLQKEMLKKTPSSPFSPAKPDILYAPTFETATLGYPAWADTLGNTFGPIAKMGSISDEFGESSTFKDLVSGRFTLSYRQPVVYKAMEEKGGRLVYSFDDYGLLLDTCPVPMAHPLIVLDGGGIYSSYSEGFGHILTKGFAMSFRNMSIELDCYKLNGAGPGCTPLLVLSAKTELNQIPWKIFPNPGKNTLNISGELWKSITIRDVQGKLTESHFGSLHKESIDVKPLPVGLYFISIAGQNGQIQQLKWIKE